MEELPCEAYYYRIGSSIRRLRLENGMTQEGLAEKSGLSLKMIQKLEGGQSGFRMETVIKIAITLDVSLDILAGIQKTDERIAVWQEAFYTLAKDKSIEEIKYAVGIVDCIFKLHKKYLE